MISKLYQEGNKKPSHVCDPQESLANKTKDHAIDHQNFRKRHLKEKGQKTTDYLNVYM